MIFQSHSGPLNPFGDGQVLGLYIELVDIGYRASKLQLVEFGLRLAKQRPRFSCPFSAFFVDFSPIDRVVAF